MPANWRPRTFRAGWRLAAAAAIAALLLPLSQPASTRAAAPTMDTPDEVGTFVTSELPSPLTVAPRTASEPIPQLPWLSPEPLDQVPSAAPPAPASAVDPTEPPSGPAPQTATVLTGFDGLDYTNTAGYEPPDTFVAVGPDYVMETVNLTGRVWTRAGTPVWTWDLRTWLSVSPAYLTSDPKVIYDQASNRFIFVMIGMNTFSLATATTGYVWIAVSNTPDPTGSWHGKVYSFSNLPDYPGLGVSDDKVVITSNGFAFGSGSFIGADTLIINKAQLLAGGAVSYGYYGPNASYFTIQPAPSLSSTSDLWMGSVAFGTSSTLRVYKVSGVPGVGSVVRTSYVLAISTISNPPNAVQKGSATTIETNDSRLLSASWRNGVLWLVSTTGCSWASSGDPTTRSCVWYGRVDTTGASPTMIGDSYFGNPGEYYYFPAVTMDGAGTAYVGFNRSSSTEYASVRYRNWLAGAGFWSGSSAQLHAGTTSYNGTRWGDFSGAAPDPMNRNAVWIGGEYAKTIVAARKWGTYIGQIAEGVSASTTWYFAEGYTGPGFVEYLTIQNPNSSTAGVTITYYLASGGPVVKTINVPANSRYTVSVNDTAEGVGPGQAVSTRITSTLPVVAERPMYFSYGAQGWTGGHVAVGATQLSKTWYFAEGYTGTGFDEYLTIQNPNASTASLAITYYLASGGPVVKSINVPANSRYTVTVHDTAEGVGRDQAVSALITSTQPIVAERPMYFSYGAGGWTGGHVSLGATGPTGTWYFAEGYTGTGFDEYLTLQNPNLTAASATLTYYLASGSPVVKSISVPANSRYTVKVHETTEGVGRDQAVSTRVQANLPLVVERPMYFSYGASGWTGGHDAMGANNPSNVWYFAEGYTGTGFDEYLTLQNPNPTTAGVTLTYYLASGGPVVKSINVPANSRYTVKVHETAEGVGRGQAVSTKISSLLPIVAERPMYFSYGAQGWTGGHDAMGYAP